uniref:Uncharacterized protein n=1 Tax=Plectus sambesii TaxID=2011161 RepID=A0A914UIU9_9BILA
MCNKGACGATEIDEACILNSSIEPTETSSDEIESEEEGSQLNEIVAQMVDSVAIEEHAFTSTDNQIAHTVPFDVLTTVEWILTPQQLTVECQSETDARLIVYELIDLVECHINSEPDLCSRSPLPFLLAIRNTRLILSTLQLISAST